MSQAHLRKLARLHDMDVIREATRNSDRAGFDITTVLDSLRATRPRHSSTMPWIFGKCTFTVIGLLIWCYYKRNIVIRIWKICPARTVTRRNPLSRPHGRTDPAVRFTSDANCNIATVFPLQCYSVRRGRRDRRRRNAIGTCI